MASDHCCRDASCSDRRRAGADEAAELRAQAPSRHFLPPVNQSSKRIVRVVDGDEP